MPRMTDFILIDQDAQPAIVIRKTVSLDTLPQAIGDSYQKLAHYLQESQTVLAGMPFVSYHNMDMQNLKVEIGFPVRKPMPDHGDITTVSIQEGLRLTCIFRGPYSQLEPVYAEMQEYMNENNLVNTGPVYECYLNGPEFPEEELLTQIIMPVMKRNAEKMSESH